MSALTNRIRKSIENRFAGILDNAGLLKWAAPVRSLRQLCGWQAKPLPLARARRILVIRPDEIGDLILTSPFLRELRKAAPQAEITLLVKPACYELVRHCPHTDAVLTIQFASPWQKLSVLDVGWQVLKLKLSATGLRGFDLVLLPRRDTDWYGSVLAGHLLAGSGTVIVHRDKMVNNLMPPPKPPPIPVFPVSNPKIEHEVLHHLYFLSACGAEFPGDSRLEIWLTEADRDFARGWLAEAYANRAPLVVLHPSGGRSVLKQWPRNNFRDLLSRLLAESSCNFLVIGGADETWIPKDIIEGSSKRVVEAVGKFSLRQLAAVLERATLFAGGDSGPMHVAAAVGTRVLALFGPTCETRFRPWGENCRVVSLRYECSPDRTGTYKDRCEICRFSDPRCLTELPVARVFDEVRAVLGLPAGLKAIQPN